MDIDTRLVVIRLGLDYVRLHPGMPAAVGRPICVCYRYSEYFAIEKNCTMPTSVKRDFEISLVCTQMCLMSVF